MKKILHTFLISSMLLAGALFVNAAFTEKTTPPAGSNSSGPIDAGDENQLKNGSLTIQEFTAGTTNRPVQIDTNGNVSVGVSTPDGPISSVRMVVDGDIIGSTLSGSSNQKICIGSTSGSVANGYPLVKCQ